MDVQYLCINRSNLLTGVFSTMASKESTRKNFFKKDPVHGKAKRVILKKTLQAWIPCQLYMGYNKIFYIDGFSGKGVYKQTEQHKHIPTEDYGSPVIALDCVLDCFRDVTEKFRKQEEETGISLEMLLENPDDYRGTAKYRYYIFKYQISGCNTYCDLVD